MTRYDKEKFYVVSFSFSHCMVHWMCGDGVKGEEKKSSLTTAGEIVCYVWDEDK